MNTVTYLEMQLANIHAIYHDLVHDLSEQEWLVRPTPGQNCIGYNIWHIPRTQDNIVQLWIRGKAEVCHQAAWTHWQTLRPAGIGVGITLTEADAVATHVQRDETLAYADAVHQEILTWLRQCQDEDLDRVPDVAAHLASYSEYQTEGYRGQLNSLFNQPIWNLLLRPCIGHVQRHLGELELAKAMLRAS